MDCSRFDGKPSKKGARKLLGQGGNEKPSKMGKSRKSPGIAMPMCLSRSRLLFLTGKWKASKKGKGRKSLGQGNGKPSKEDKRTLRLASQLLSKHPEMVDMWKSWGFHDHDLCIQSLRPRTFEDLTFKEAMSILVDGGDLDAEFDREDSSSSDIDMDDDDDSI